MTTLVASPIGTPLATTIAGESLWLLPERALWWPAQRTLWVADLHLGKAATFRALGQPVPSGTTGTNLQRLSDLVAHYQPEQLVFLGDFLHAAQARTPALLAALAGWRRQHAGLACTLVRGNHDSHAGDPPVELGITVVEEPHAMGPFAACHHPQTHSDLFVLAGHVHPAIGLRGAGRERLRLPCFCLESGQLVLPAFGEFTGGWTVTREAGRQLFAVGGQLVWRIPDAQPSVTSGWPLR